MSMDETTSAATIGPNPVEKTMDDLREACARQERRERRRREADRILRQTLYEGIQREMNRALLERISRES